MKFHESSAWPAAVRAIGSAGDRGPLQVMGDKTVAHTITGTKNAAAGRMKTSRLFAPIARHRAI